MKRNNGTTENSRFEYTTGLGNNYDDVLTLFQKFDLTITLKRSRNTIVIILAPSCICSNLGFLRCQLLSVFPLPVTK